MMYCWWFDVHNRIRAVLNMNPYTYISCRGFPALIQYRRDGSSSSWHLRLYVQNEPTETPKKSLDYLPIHAFFILRYHRKRLKRPGSDLYKKIKVTNLL